MTTQQRAVTLLKRHNLLPASDKQTAQLKIYIKLKLKKEGREGLRVDVPQNSSPA